MAHQLNLLGLSPFGFQDLRSKTAVYLRENMNDFLPFIASSKSEDLLSPEEYEKYCNNVAETSAWGGAVEVFFVFSTRYKLQSNSLMWKFIYLSASSFV